jgi:lipid-A-disaccharide synthase
VSTILLTCGETSGEHHASRVVRELKRLDADIRIIALGGRELERAGAEVAYPMDRYAFMGFSEIVSGLPAIASLERKLTRLLRSGDIDLFIPVDYPGFNLRLARAARRAGVPVLYFISPQIWAWGRWRIRKMRRLVDLMAVILPFEEKLYRSAGIPSVFVGNPLLDEISAPSAPKEAPHPGDEFNVLVFPGSRKQEVKRMLPPAMGAIRLLADRFPGARFRLGLAPLIGDDIIEGNHGLGDRLTVTRRGIEELDETSFVLAASGTVTLQSAISGTPLVVFYRTSGMTFFIGRMLVTIPHIAMPNVLAGKKIVPELIQNAAGPERIADEAAGILEDPERYRSISQSLLGLRKHLAGHGGTGAVASIAARIIEGERPRDIAASFRP